MARSGSHTITKEHVGMDQYKHCCIVKCSCGWSKMERWDKVPLYFTCPNSPLNLLRPLGRGMTKIRETPTEKVQRLLLEQGYKVTQWIPTLGHWRKSKADVCCWECFAYHEGREINLAGWDTVTLCARRGIEVLYDAQFRQWDVYAKSVVRN